MSLDHSSEKTLENLLDIPSANQELFELLRIQSVSTDSTRVLEMERTAKWLQNKLSSLGFEAAVEATAGHPVVFAQKIISDEKPTVLIYGHYDVQPEDPLEEWLSAPFEPTLRRDRVYARGATDDKGQLYAHVRGVQLLQEAGDLPCNIKFLLEGEEEMGSPNLGAYISANAPRLAADVIVISDGSRFASEIPSITYGVRGLTYFEVHVQGADRDLHSGVYGGAAPNPINALAQIIVKLHDEQGRVNVPSFYDDVQPLRPEERAAWATLPHDDAVWAASIGVNELIGEVGYNALEKTWGRPTLDCNGIWGGFQGEGSKTVIPAKAGAKISCRLVANQDENKIYQLLEAYIPTLAPRGVKVTVKPHHHGTAMVMDLSSPYFAAAERATERAFGVRPVFIRTGGSIPIALALKTALKCEIIFLDLGVNEDNLHSPNESFSLKDYHRGILASAYMFQEIGKLDKNL